MDSLRWPRWPGQPARCACGRVIVATVEETLDCPGRWWWTGTAWAHVLGDAP